MYTQWRFRGLDPAVAFGTVGDPWPGRHDAFLTACAIYAGNRERDLSDIVEGLAKG